MDHNLVTQGCVIQTNRLIEYLCLWIVEKNVNISDVLLLLFRFFFQITKSYWKAWQDFEVRHGNEDTFREMLRIKRSVQAQFNTQVN